VVSSACGPGRYALRRLYRTLAADDLWLRLRLGGAQRQREGEDEGRDQRDRMGA
jgi:hypothetical protein